MFFLFAKDTEHRSCFFTKRNSFSSLPSIFCVTVLLISSSLGLSVLTNNFSHASALPLVVENSPSVKVSLSPKDNLVTGGERRRRPEANAILDSQEKQSYAEDSLEGLRDFSEDNSQTRQSYSKLQTSEDDIPFSVFVKKPWFHSWSGKKRNEGRALGYGPRSMGVHHRMVSNQKGRSDVVSKTAPFPALSDQKMKGNFRSLKPGSASSFSSRQSDQNYSLEKPKYTQFNNKPNVEQLIKNVTRQNNGIRINVMKFKHKEGFVRFKRSSRLALASNKKLLTKACIMLEFGQNGSVYNRVMSTSFGKECIAQALKLLNQRKLENADQNEKQKNMNDLFVLASRGGGRSRDFEVANEMYPINDPFHHNSESYLPDTENAESSGGEESFSQYLKDCLGLLNCLHLLNADTHFGLHKDMAIDRHGERLNDKTSLNSEDGENDIPYDAISNGEPRRLIDDDDDDSGFSPLRNLNAKNGNYNDVAVKPVVHLDPSEKYADDQSQEELSPVQDFIQTYKNILATKSARKPRTGIVSDRAEPSGLSNSVTYGFQKSDSDSGVNDDSIQFFESSSMGGGDQEIPDEKDVISKRPSFHSWSGKRSAQKNSLSKKPSFHSWSGKRSAPGNVQFKRPSFHSWSGKRHVPENAPLKRPSFHSWSGKRSINENFIAKKPSFHSWSGKRNARDKVSFKRPSFHSWSGKRNVNDITSFKTPSFHSWSGKRNGNENTNFKRPSFHSWSGKRDINEFLNYKRPSFHSWSG